MLLFRKEDGERRYIELGAALVFTAFFQFVLVNATMAYFKFRTASVLAVAEQANDD